MDRLKQTLDRFYREYNFEERLTHDPIEFPHRYNDPRDIEISGFIASSIAYGRVELFSSVIEKILSAMGSSPYSFIMDFNVRRDRSLFRFKYRFNEADDILCLIYILHELLKKHSSLESLFKRYYRDGDRNTFESISGFIKETMSVSTISVYGRDIRPFGLMQLLPSPEKGSACKRMNLFLRWMVREKDIDFGIWKSIPKERLVIPLDTHIARISRCLGFTKRAAADWKTAVEITEALKRLDPQDPLKYDFALCHQGISGICRADGSSCRDCLFEEFRTAEVNSL